MTATLVQPAVPRPRVSATALGAFDTCPRSWWYGYVVGLKGPPTVQMAYGTDLHAEVERFLNGFGWGTDPRRSAILEDHYRDVVRRARVAEDILLPMRARVLAGKAVVEKKIEGTLGPLPFSGRIDYIDPELRIVVDHKTTSDLYASWHRGTWDIGEDQQMLLYAAYALEPGAPFGVAHLRYATKGEPQAMLVASDKPVPWDRAEAIVAAGAATARRMAGMWDVPEARVAEIEWKATGCGKYGGCAFRDRCPDSPDNRASRYGSFTNREEEAVTKVNNVDDLFGGGSKVSKPKPKQTPKIEDEDTEGDDAGVSLDTLFGGGVQTRTEQFSPPDARPDHVPAHDNGKGQDPMDVAMAEIALLGGGWPGDEVGRKIARDAGVPFKAFKAAVKARPAQDKPAAPVEEEGVPDSVVDLEAIAREVVERHEMAVDPGTQEDMVTQLVRIGNGPAGGVLVLMDCVPSGIEAVPFRAAFREGIDAIGVMPWQDGKTYPIDMIPFRGGPGALAAWVDYAYKGNERFRLQPLVVQCSSRDPLVPAVIEVLKSHGAAVIQGMGA